SPAVYSERFPGFARNDKRNTFALQNVITSSDLNNSNRQRLGNLVVWLGAAVFFASTTAVSWLRWANFHYRTFDLAYYVQAIWQLVHGRLAVSVENVPLLGNHVEPIIFLFAPVFGLIRHPMIFVVIQNAAIATM